MYKGFLPNASPNRDPKNCFNSFSHSYRIFLGRMMRSFAYNPSFFYNFNQRPTIFGTMIYIIVIFAIFCVSMIRRKFLLQVVQKVIYLHFLSLGIFLFDFLMILKLLFCLFFQQFILFWIISLYYLFLISLYFCQTYVQCLFHYRLFVMLYLAI